MKNLLTKLIMFCKKNQETIIWDFILPIALAVVLFFAIKRALQLF